MRAPLSQTPGLEKGARGPRPPGCAPWACEPGALRRVQPPRATLGRGNRRPSSRYAEPLSVDGVTEGADDVLTTGTRSPGSASQCQQHPLLACRRVEVGVHPRTGSAHAHPPARTRGLSHARQRPGADPLLPRLGPPPPPEALGPLLPGKPLPSRSPRCSYLRPSSIRLSGGDPEPASSAGPAAAGGEDAAAAPGSPSPHPGLSPRGRRDTALAPDPGLAPRVRPAGGREAGEAERGSPAAAYAPRGQAQRAERSEQPGSGREQKGLALGRAPEGGAWRGGGGHAGARPCGSRAKAPSRQWAGGQKTRRNPVARSLAAVSCVCPGCANTRFSAGHLLVFQSCSAKEHSSALLCLQGCPSPLGGMEAWEAGRGRGGGSVLLGRLHRRGDVSLDRKR